MESPKTPPVGPHVYPEHESSSSLRTPPEGAWPTPAPTLPFAADPAIPHRGHLAIGSWVGPYRIESLLAEGGMGAVYRARSVIPVREVALKVIRPGLVSDRLLKRFELEAEVLRRLDHPGIARIFAAGSFDAGGGPQPYFAMELVPGKPLNHYVREHELTLLERLALAAKICDAVQHAHTKGVIHRDLKPGNVLVIDVPITRTHLDAATPAPPAPGAAPAETPDDRADPWCSLACEPKVLDFGVARLVDASDEPTVRTVAGQMVGTVPYMSPEQVGGDPHDVDTRSDVYALGVTLYELITGHLPYDVARVGLLEAARIIREQPPQPLPALPRRLEAGVRAVVAKSLQKDRLRRYQSAADLAADLRRLLAGEPVAARPLSARDLLATILRRHRPWALAVGTAAAALLAGVAISTYSVGFSQGERLRPTSAMPRPEADPFELLLAEARRHAQAGHPDLASAALALAAARAQDRPDHAALLARLSALQAELAPAASR